jgi:hypothetical protein
LSDEVVVDGATLLREAEAKMKKLISDALNSTARAQAARLNARTAAATAATAMTTTIVTATVEQTNAKHP